MNIQSIAANPPEFISAKHLKGMTVSEALAEGDLLSNYTLVLKFFRSGDDLVISSARYCRHDGNGQTIKTIEIQSPIADPRETNTFIDFEKRVTFKTLRKVFQKLSPKAKDRFRNQLKFLLSEMNIELVRAHHRKA